MAVVLGIRPPIYLLGGAIFYFFFVTGEGDLISIFITWEFEGGGLGGLISRHSWSSIL